MGKTQSAAKVVRIRAKTQAHVSFAVVRDFMFEGDLEKMKQDEPWRQKN